MNTNEKPDHPKLKEFLRAYRAKHGVESVQVTKSGALIPTKAARAWTAHLAKDSK
jgi:hypothetical protein